jgi:hypothetical protein
MKIVNDGLTEPLYQAVLDAQDEYSPGEADITTTTLIGPAWIRHLKKEHDEEIVVNASSMLYMLDGTALHSILEKAGRKLEHYIVEERYYAQVNGQKIGGQIDAYNTEIKTLIDYKKSFTSQYMYGVKPDYEAQANINAWIMRQNGLEVDQLLLVYYLKDHRKAKVGLDPDYPSKIEAVSEVKMWSDDETYEYIVKRLNAHVDPQPCTGAEKWAKFAVMKQGRKTALRVLDTEEEAYAWIKIKVTDQELPIVSVEEREPGRCKDYCSVNAFCQWYQERLHG